MKPAGGEKATVRLRTQVRDCPSASDFRRFSVSTRWPARTSGVVSLVICLALAGAGTAHAQSNVWKFRDLPYYEPLKADPRLKREVLVGGCQSRCAKPQQSLKGFMTAVMKKDIDDVRSFVDSSELIGNGERLGEQWANLFLERKLGERRESIDKWLKDWLAWVDRIADPADREKTEAGFTVVEENQRQYVVTYLHPDLTDGAATGVLWTFGLQTRGLEWLVVKIEVRPSP